MAGGRKLWVSLLGIACVMVLALASRGLDAQVIQAAITALLVIVPGYGLSNVGATFAHKTSGSGSRTAGTDTEAGE